jgi:hypothetical protein
MKFLKNLAKTTVAGLVLAGGLSLAQADRADALSLTFAPAKANIDSDPVRDYETSVGAPINFDLILNTNGLAGPISTLSYFIAWDKTELGKFSFTPLESVDSLVNEGGTGFLGFPEGTLRSITQSFTPLAANSERVIGNVSFQVLAGLVNDGRPDFATYFTFFDEESFFSTSNLQTIEVQAVPTPALLPGLAAMGMGLLRRKKAQEAAA